MKDLLLIILKGLVEDTSAVTVTEDQPNEDGVITYHIRVASDDMGRIIGKQGRIAKAIRSIAKASANRAGQKIYISIED